MNGGTCLWCGSTATYVDCEGPNGEQTGPWACLDCDATQLHPHTRLADGGTSAYERWTETRLRYRRVIFGAYFWRMLWYLIKYHQRASRIWR